MMKKIVFKFSIILLILNVSITRADSLTVLFLGNSHTFSNDVPQLVANLVLSLGDTLIYESNTPGGCTLGHPENGHLYNPVSLALIDSMAWDYVILQEHSLFAVIEYYRNKYMYPGAKSLDSLIKLNNECTETIVQIIWGKKYGGEYCMYEHCSVDFVDFAHMQDSLISKYRRLGDTISCTLSPAGPAWKQSIINGDPIELFSSDESHASLAGAYLAACVHYGVLFQKPVSGASFTGGLNPEDAFYFQNIADYIVFNNPDLWNINGNKPLAGFEFTQTENTVVFNDTSKNATYYAWDFGDGTTDTVQNPVITYNSSGTFVVTQEVGNSCFSDITTDTINVDIIAIPENNGLDPDIRVTPLNSQGRYRIFTKHSFIHKIEIYRSDGSLIKIKSLNGKNECLLDINQFPFGLYILKIYTDSGIETFKLPYK